MQFSDTATRQGLIQDCEDLMNFPVTGISGNTTLLQTFTRNINQWYHKVITMILASQDSWDFDDITFTGTSPIVTRALVAGQRDYKFPTALWSLIQAESAAVSPTISIASPGVITLTAHGFNIGDGVQFTTTGTLPTGITAGTIYYVISAGYTANAFEISATLGGAAVNTTGSQSGTHSLTRNISPLRIKRVDVTYDGSTYYKCELFDTGMTGVGLGNDVNTDGLFSKSKPFYDIASNGINIYPLASASDVTNGAKLRVELVRSISEFQTSDTTKTPGFDAPFHRILSYGACYDFSLTKSLPQADRLFEKTQDLEQRLKQYYGLKDTDSQFTFQPAYITYE